jgi:hypothetical protein
MLLAALLERLLQPCPQKPLEERSEEGSQGLQV